ncbi:MAG: nucleoside hydrolase [Alphaproteobacteria bacterium]
MALVLCGVFLASASGSARDIWIDTDPACGAARTDDVDDCWALVAALRSPNLNIIGVSSVFGNETVERTTASLHDVLRVVATELRGTVMPPVFPGAGQAGKKSADVSAAVLGMAAALERQSLTLVALGPLTNIAALLTLRPDLTHRIDAIVAVAGQRPGQRFTVGRSKILHLHDFNVRKDAEAVATVLRSRISLHLVPFDAAKQITVAAKDLDKMTRRGGVDAWLAVQSRAWLSFWQDDLKADGFHPFDALAVSYVASLQNFDCQQFAVKRIDRRGLFVERDTLEFSDAIVGDKTARVCTVVSPALSADPLRLVGLRQSGGMPSDPVGYR